MIYQLINFLFFYFQKRGENQYLILQYNKQQNFTPKFFHNSLIKIYTVPKGVIIEWINNLLPNNRVSKIEQLSSGHHYLILLDALWPSSFSFTKAYYSAQNEYEKEQNFKIIQQALTKHNIDQYCDPGKLSKGKMQDNLEFAQWFKHFFESQYQIESIVIDDLKIKQKFGKKMTNTVIQDNNQNEALLKQQEHKQKQKQIEQEAIQNAKLKAQQQQLKFMQQEQEKIQAQLQHQRMQDKILQEEQRRISQQKSEEFQQQQKQQEQLQQLAEKRRKESQFYFQKLREIEIYCGKIRDQLQTSPDQRIEQLVDQIEKILFAEYKE